MGNHWRIGLNAAIISAGGVFAGPLSGPVADKYGRKVAIAFGNALIVVGVILQASAKACESFVKFTDNHNAFTNHIY